MKKYLKLIALVLVFAMVAVFALVGCTDTNKPADNTDKPADTTDKPADGGKDFSGVTLTMSTWKLGYMNGFNEVAKLAGLTLDIDGTGEDAAYRNKVAAAANAGTLADIVHWWGTFDFEATEKMYNLSEIPEINNDTFKAKFGTTAWNALIATEAQIASIAANPDATEIQKGYKAGDFFLIPTDIGSANVMMANKKLLDEAGIPTDVPATFEEMVKRGKDYTAKTGKSAFGGSTQIMGVWADWQLTPLIYMWNGIDGYIERVNPWGTLTTDGPVYRAIDAFASMFDTENVFQPGQMSLNIDDSDQQFALGNTVYQSSGSYTAATLINMGMDMNDVYSFPTPPLAGSKVTNWTVEPFCLTGFGIAKNTQNYDAVLHYFDVFATPEGSVAMTNNGYTISAALATGKESEITPMFSDVMKMYVYDGTPLPTQFKNTYPNLNTMGIQAYSEQQNGMQAICNGTATAADVIADMNAANKANVESGSLDDYKALVAEDLAKAGITLD